MRLPIIKKALEQINNDGEESIHTAVKVLEEISQARGIKENEIEVIGELISNLLGAIEVKKSIDDGAEEREALNSFMQRVMGSIDR